VAGIDAIAVGIEFDARANRRPVRARVSECDAPEDVANELVAR
jgi:hypothetical protein